MSLEVSAQYCTSLWAVDRVQQTRWYHIIRWCSPWIPQYWQMDKAPRTIPLKVCPSNYGISHLTPQFQPPKLVVERCSRHSPTLRIVWQPHAALGQCTFSPLILLLVDCMNMWEKLVLRQEEHVPLFWSHFSKQPLQNCCPQQFIRWGSHNTFKQIEQVSSSGTASTNSRSSPPVEAAILILLSKHTLVSFN